MMKQQRQRNFIEQGIIAIPRWILRIGLVIVIILVVFGALKACQGEIEPPPVDQAPWAIQTYIYTNNLEGGIEKTPSRYYLGREYSEMDGVPSLKGYWDFDGKAYNYHDEVISFQPSLYGRVDVILRKE